jgi:hypothetical protein
VRTIACAAGALLLTACASPRPPQLGPGAAPVGAPNLSFDESVLDKAAPGATRADAGEAVRLPDRFILPASYRLMLLDGRLTLVRETDPQAVEAAPTSLRIVAGEISRGELAYQPALLPQELAAEVSADRESTARISAALDAVMRRSRELSDQALEIEAQGKRLAAMLAASEDRVRQLEAEARPAQPSPAQAGEAPKETPEQPSP